MDNDTYVEFYLHGGHIISGTGNSNQLDKIKDKLSVHGGGCVRIKDSDGYDLLIVLDEVVAIRYVAEEI